MDKSQFGICNKCGAYQYLSYITCNYNGVCNGRVVPEDTRSNREKSIEWWNKLSKEQIIQFTKAQRDKTSPHLKEIPLTGREIEEIWKTIKT